MIINLFFFGRMYGNLISVIFFLCVCAEALFEICVFMKCLYLGLRLYALCLFERRNLSRIDM